MQRTAVVLFLVPGVHFVELCQIVGDIVCQRIPVDDLHISITHGGSEERRVNGRQGVVSSTHGVL